MKLMNKEHYDLMSQFEKEFRYLGRMDKEPKNIWAKGHIYQQGIVNEMFLAYRMGYALGKSVPLG